MDPIDEIDFSKDSTVAIIKNLQKKAKIKLIIPDSIDYDSNNVFGSLCDLEIISLKKKKYVQKNSKRMNLNKLDCIFFRKDPPVDQKYISILQMLRELEYQDTLVINSPESLIRFNEKVLGCRLSIPKIPTIISSNSTSIYLPRCPLAKTNPCSVSVIPISTDSSPTKFPSTYNKIFSCATSLTATT